jgi:IS66 C-terminal element
VSNSERALRVAALGRKNFLFVGSDEAGENLAGLYSLIATCEANDINPVDYLTDVLIRVQTPGLADRRAAAAQLELVAAGEHVLTASQLAPLRDDVLARFAECGLRTPKVRLDLEVLGCESSRVPEFPVFGVGKVSGRP